ncbi:MAG: response regulator, partial [Deltaproteobacteria bacterium]|nr:response regulator [Deltaproteobacteria bacterium]
MKKYNILLVDDDHLILKSLGPALEGRGYEVATSDNGAEAIEMITGSHYDMVITDLVMMPVDGLEVLKKSKEIRPDILVIILTGFGDMGSSIDALRLDADNYLLKPCEPEELYFRVSNCFRKLELRRKVKLYEKILPVCCQCKKIRDDADREPGTGRWMAVEEYIRDRAKVDVTS